MGRRAGRARARAARRRSALCRRARRVLVSRAPAAWPGSRPRAGIVTAASPGGWGFVTAHDFGGDRVCRGAAGEQGYRNQQGGREGRPAARPLGHGSRRVQVRDGSRVAAAARVVGQRRTKGVRTSCWQALGMAWARVTHARGPRGLPAAGCSYRQDAGASCMLWLSVRRCFPRCCFARELAHGSHPGRTACQRAHLQARGAGVTGQSSVYVNRSLWVAPEPVVAVADGTLPR